MSQAFTVCRLTPEEAASKFGELTVLELRSLLGELLPMEYDDESFLLPNICLAWGVFDCETPIALLLVRLTARASNGTGLCLNVLSLAVRKPWRRLRVATRLLDAAEAWARKNGIQSICIDIPLNRASTAALEAMTSLEKGWTESPGLVLVTISDRARFLPLQEKINQFAIRHEQRWGLQVENMTTALLKQLQSQRLDSVLPNWALEQLLTEQSELPPDLPHCRVLRDGACLVGWLICHRPSSKRLRYTCAWVDPPWDRRGAIFLMLNKVIKQAHFQSSPGCSSGAETAFPIEHGCFGFHLDNSPMVKMSLRKFSSIATHWIQTQRRLLEIR
jgi:GNAT superfamily N-acetyltransferase